MLIDDDVNDDSGDRGDGACLVGGGCVGQVGGLQTAFSNSPIAVGAPPTCHPWMNISDIGYFLRISMLLVVGL